MALCPHCQRPIFGKNATHTKDSYQIDVRCANCKAILRIQVTTLKDPEHDKLADIKEKDSVLQVTFCSKCSGRIIIGKEKEHACSIEETKEVQHELSI